MPIVPKPAIPAYPGRRWEARMYPGRLSMTSLVRADVRADLAKLAGITEDLAENVVLCASEAFANATAHSRSGSRDGAVMRILSTPIVTDWETTLRLSVIDDGPVNSRPMIPAQRTVEEWEEAERGRGLLLINHLATEWGTARVMNIPDCEALSTVTWAEFVYPTGKTNR